MTDKSTISKLGLIGSASGWGAKRGGTEDGPDKALAHFLLKEDAPLSKYYDWLGTAYTPIKRFLKDSDDDQHIRENIVTQIQFLHLLIQKTVSKGVFPLIFGGDHAAALGTWSSVVSTLNKTPDNRFGLIWFDAHMDAHTPETSPSNRYHGMPVAALLGHGHPEFVNAIYPGTKIQPEDIVLVGVRSFEEGEESLLRSLNVRIYFEDEVINRGLENVLREINASLIDNVSHYGISLDLDVFDSGTITGIGSPVPGLIDPQMFIDALDEIIDPLKLSCFEIMEYNPHMDEGEQTLYWIEKILERFAKIYRGA